MILYSHNIICHRTYFKIWKILSFFAIFDSLSIPTTSQTGSQIQCSAYIIKFKKPNGSADKY